ncbi:hypothetical protein BD289DRAFT_227205 [Coniella lustricola]|uniref:Uncharacterized protein n=1 Tax=Coniella lustricola TaxID=2025994 RepID=A0A2T3AAN8_9PEZI|nr:hypothetical protein BD289DRAFT_227205 [Coniella lustricola]
MLALRKNPSLRQSIFSSSFIVSVRCLGQCLAQTVVTAQSQANAPIDNSSLAHFTHRPIVLSSRPPRPPRHRHNMNNTHHSHLLLPSPRNPGRIRNNGQQGNKHGRKQQGA